MLVVYDFMTCYWSTCRILLSCHFLFSTTSADHDNIFMSLKTDFIILSWSPHVDLSNYVDFCYDIDEGDIPSPCTVYIKKLK